MESVYENSINDDIVESQPPAIDTAAGGGSYRYANSGVYYAPFSDPISLSYWTPQSVSSSQLKPLQFQQNTERNLVHLLDPVNRLYQSIFKFQSSRSTPPKRKRMSKRSSNRYNQTQQSQSALKDQRNFVQSNSVKRCERCGQPYSNDAQYASKPQKSENHSNEYSIRRFEKTSQHP